MKTKHILAVLSTCLVAVSFSPINFFSQAAPPPGFTMFDGKEFQFDVPDTTMNTWLPAFTCPAGGNMKIETCTTNEVSDYYIKLKVTRSSNGQEVIMTYYSSRIDPFILSSGDILEYHLDSMQQLYSVSIHGVID